MRKTLFIIFGFGAAMHLRAQESIIIGSGTNITASNGANIVLTNTNLINNGTLSQSSGEVIKFTGGTDITVSGTGSINAGTLRISKNIGSKLTLSEDLTILNQLYFENGLLDLGNNHILLQGTATLTGESETGRALSTGTGYIEASAVLNNPVSSNIGSLGAFITSSENLGNVTIRRGHQSQVNAFGNGSTVLRYYDIAATNNNSLNATLRFTYLDAELNGFDESVLTLYRSVDNTTWTNFGADTRDAINNYVEKTGISQFSRWALSEATSTLPVKFTYLNAKCDGGSSKITWKVLNQENVHSYNIERSNDGRSWMAIGTVQSTPNTIQEQTYSYLDTKAMGNDYYRVVENNMDNNKYYSSIIRSNCNSAATFGLTPNPVLNTFTVNLSSTTASRNKFTLFNAAGYVVATKEVFVLPGVSQISFDISYVPVGIYSLVMYGEHGETKTIKVIKQ